MLSCQYVVLTLRGQVRFQCRERAAPPVGRALQRDVLREAVAGGVPPGNRVPGTMLDRYAGLLTDGLEENFDLGGLLGREARLAPGEDQALSGLPYGDAADLEDLAAGQSRNEASARAGLEGQLTVALRGDLKEGARLPPGSNLLREGLEGTFRIGGYAQCDKGFRCHFFVFCRCALNAESCFAHKASVSASQVFSSDIASGLSL